MEQQTLLNATAQVTIHALPERVWKSLTDPEEIKQYMMGANITTDWTLGSDIIWKGEWQGKPFEDKGKIVQFDENKKLRYTHYSPLSGKEDSPENYHTVTISLEETEEDKTRVSLSQTGNESEKEQEHAAQMWQSMLDGMKKLIEGKG
jgi:uncharacterized protein YndB with AHSA1/START domain